MASITYVPAEIDKISKHSNEYVTIQSPFMTKKEIAEYFRCSIRKIDRMRKNGMIKSINIGRVVLFDKRENNIKDIR